MLYAVSRVYTLYLSGAGLEADDPAQCASLASGLNGGFLKANPSSIMKVLTSQCPRL